MVYYWKGEKNMEYYIREEKFDSIEKKINSIKSNKQTLVTRCRFGVKEKEKKKNLPTTEEALDAFFKYLDEAD